jgi:hypothetical protein
MKLCVSSTLMSCTVDSSGTRSTDSTMSKDPSWPNIAIPGRTEDAGMNGRDLDPIRA